MPYSIARLTRRAAFLAAPAGMLALGACNLDVTTPDVVLPSTLQGAQANQTRLAAAVGDFAVAYSGYSEGNAGEGIALFSGLFADEFTAADLFAEHSSADQRNIGTSNSVNSTVLRSVIRSLNSAQSAASAYAQFNGANDAGRATALNLLGFDYLFLAENYCSGVPLSSINAQGQVQYGASQSTQQLLDSAVAAFTTAEQVATVAKNATQLNAARVGHGRALLDQGQFAQAAAAVAAVPNDFVYSTEQGTTDVRERSGMYELLYVSTRYSVADVEGQNGLPFVSANDPRLVTDSLDLSSFDQQTYLYAPTKYNSYTATTVIASGVEARLIRAEAALKAGSYGTTLQILNAIRADSGLAPLAAAATPAAQVQQLFQERAFFLFGTAHRLGDLRRLVRQYGLTQAQVFPTGAYRRGGTYGTQVNLRVPQEESQNPNFNPSACDPNAA